MSKTVNAILKEATEGLLTDETLGLIEEAFNSAVNERAQLHVEKALIEQDEDYAGKLTKLLSVKFLITLNCIWKKQFRLQKLRKL